MLKLLQANPVKSVRDSLPGPSKCGLAGTRRSCLSRVSLSGFVSAQLQFKRHREADIIFKHVSPLRDPLRYLSDSGDPPT